MGIVFKYVAIFLVLYFILNRFILPVFRLTNQTQQKMRQMQDKINQMEKQVNKNNGKNAKRDGDYIDYEDVSQQ